MPVLTELSQSAGSVALECCSLCRIGTFVMVRLVRISAQDVAQLVKDLTRDYLGLNLSLVRHNFSHALH